MKMTRFRWVLVALLFLATTINYMDRQVLSLTWKDFIRPEFDWTDSDYGTITGLFSIFYAIANLFAGKFVDWVGTKKGYLIAIGVWSVGAVLHSFSGILTCGVLTGHWFVGFEEAKQLLEAFAASGQLTGVYDGNGKAVETYTYISFGMVWRSSIATAATISTNPLSAAAIPLPQTARSCSMTGSAVRAPSKAMKATA